MLHPDSDGIHKFVARFPEGGVVHFGQRGSSDYTIHKDRERMLRYVKRHRSRENWKRSGAKTAGFWSRWLLWSEPSFEHALARTQKIIQRPILFCHPPSTVKSKH